MELSDGFSAAAVCGRLLADLGCSVRKVEQSGGDSIRSVGPSNSSGQSHLATSLFRGKTVVSGPAGAEQLLEVAGSTDLVVVDEAWLGVLHDRDLDSPQRWWSVNPRLIVATVTPYGAGIVHQDLGPATDFTLQAAGGITMTTGFADGGPTRPGVAISTHAAGLLALAGLLAALYRSRATGRGDWLDIAGLDSLVLMLGNVLPGYVQPASDSVRSGNVQPLSAPWNSYPAADGDVVIVAISDTKWRRLVRVIGRPDLAGDLRFANKTQRVRHRDEIDAIIGRWTVGRTCADVVDVLTSAGIAAGAVHDLAVAVWQEGVAERGLVAEVKDGVPVVGPLLRLRDLQAGRKTPGASTVGSDESSRRIGARAPGSRPLSGVRVVELGGHTAAALCTRLLADLGAEVIKVETLRGDDARYTVPVLSDGSSFLWHSWNQAKRSLVVDLLVDDGRDVMRSLLACSDVFVVNMATDTVERFGLSPAEVAGANPDIVYCALTGFGTIGSQRTRRAYDTVLQAVAGIMSLTGRPDRPPVKTGPSVVDNVAALAATAAVVAALVRSPEGRRGCFVDAALFDVATWLTLEWWPELAGGARPTRHGNRHPYFPLENSFRCRDGVEVAISVRTADQERAARVQFSLDASSAAWDERVARFCAAHPSSTVLDECRERGIPVTVHRTVGDVDADPVVRGHALLNHVTVAGGDPCVLIGSPFAWRGEPRTSSLLAAPVLGQHTEEILRDLAGYPADRAAALSSRWVAAAREHAVGRSGALAMSRRSE